MKFGICGSANRTPGIVDALVGAKYDFMEENLFRADALDDAAFEALCETYKKAGVPVSSCNNLFSPEVTIYGENSLEEIKVYSKRVFAKAAKLGAKLCVVGSGKARSIPEGMSVDAAKERFVEMLRICGDAAAEHGIRLVIEPLYRNDSNFIHTVAEAVELARMSGRDNVGALVDFYHFSMNGEDEHGLECAKGMLFHAHMARPGDRRMPREENAEQLKTWLKMLKDIDYHGDIALEGKFDTENLLEDFSKTAEMMVDYRAL
jgi:sugar phosphate isomerase/epimerase